MKVLLPETYGFCSGVRAAIRKAEEAIAEAKLASLPCFVVGDIVHSKAVMDELIGKGLIKTERAEEAKGPGIAVIRAHGITDEERQLLLDNNLRIVDATCPVVLNSQRLIREDDGLTVVIGQQGHSEVTALLGSGNAVLVETSADLKVLEKKAYNAVVQTTFSIPGLEEIMKEASSRGIKLNLLNSVCRASIERREALEKLAGNVEAIFVAGDRNSKNTVELYEAGKSYGKPSFLVSSPSEITSGMLGFSIVGLTAGASCPDTLFQSIKRRLIDG